MLPPIRQHYPRFLGSVHLLLFPPEQRVPYAEVLHTLSLIRPEERDPVPTLSVFSGEVSTFQNPPPPGHRPQRVPSSTSPQSFRQSTRMGS